MKTPTPDELIAERVMGWKRHKMYANYNGEWMLPDGSIKHYCFTPKFTTDIAADYMVLERVRETWSVTQEREFESSLFVIWDERSSSREKTQNVSWPIHAVLYIPGDYALAALLTLESEGKK